MFTRLGKKVNISVKDNYITLYPNTMLGHELQLAQGGLPKYDQMQENTVYIYLDKENIKWAVKSQNLRQEIYDLGPLDSSIEKSLKKS
jgi:hypothetical protein